MATDLHDNPTQRDTGGDAERAGESAGSVARSHVEWGGGGREVRGGEGEGKGSKRNSWKNNARNWVAKSVDLPKNRITTPRAPTMADAAAPGGDRKKLPEGYVNKNSEKALLGVFSSAGYIDVGNKVRGSPVPDAGIAKSPKCGRRVTRLSAKIPILTSSLPPLPVGQTAALPSQAARPFQLHG